MYIPKINNSPLNIGIDAGSTTLKVVVTDKDHHIVYKNTAAIMLILQVRSTKCCRN